MRITHVFVKAVTSVLLASPLLACSMSGASDESALSNEHDGGGACTLTQGYWKNHPDAWPASSLKLGTVTYAQVDLLAIFKTPVKGNGLVQLAHQLIAAKLNIAAGAPDADISIAIAQADTLIGSLVVPPIGDGSVKTSATAELTGELDAFNTGAVGPGHCEGDDTGSDDDDDTCDHDGDCDHDDGDDCGSCNGGCDVPACGNGVIELGETCDDGNTTAGDGCSATCTIELPVCGNGVIETGETCDDGNTANGDGCSSVCLCEPCH